MPRENPMGERLVRETADLERETAEARTFTEEEHTAILAATVQRETAAMTDKNAELTEAIETLKAEKAELQSQLDVADTARETAEQALATFRADIEREREVAARTDERVKQVREVLAHKPDEWFTEDRQKAWAEMDEDRFKAYVSELAEATAGLQATTERPAERETAMAGAQVTGTESKARNFFTLQRGGN